MAVAYGENGRLRQISKAEGLTYDTEDSHLYIASDEEACLPIDNSG